jgi:hypothetical protein
MNTKVTSRNIARDLTCKKKYERPVAVELNSNPLTFGHCVTGSTATALACTNGQFTAGTGLGHSCSSGGVAGPKVSDCTVGAQPGPKG